SHIGHIKTALQLGEDDKFLSWLPLTHDLGLILFHLVPLVNNKSQSILPTHLFIRRPSLWMSKTGIHGATVLGSPNFGYRHFLNNFYEETMNQCSLDRVKFIINGAEFISAETCREFCQKLLPYGLNQHVIRPSYGLAEATLAVTFSPYGEEIKEYHVNRNYLNPGDAIRWVLPGDESATYFVDLGEPVGTEIRITDGHNNPLPEQTVGYIKVRGDSITSGYYNNPQETAKILDHDGWLNTGDLGFITKGRLIMTGRAKDLIIAGGINYYPHDIERAIEDIPGLEINKTATAGILNVKLGREEVLLFVRYKKSKDEYRGFVHTARQAKERVLQKIGLRIDHVIPVNQIPKTTSGKLQRFKLTQQYRQGEYNAIIEKIESLEQELQENKNVFHPGEDDRIEIQSFLIKTVKQLVGSDDIEMNKGLMEQGFTSLKAIQFQTIINRYFNLDLPISLIFDYPTIAGITELILNRLGPTGAALPQLFEADPDKISINEPIAVIGIGCRFPPYADTPGAFWDSLQKGIDAVTEIPAGRWDIKNFYSEDTDEPGKMYTKYGAFLDNVDRFDNEFFSITPREAESMDPQQRILLEVCYQALENAGLNIERLNNSNTCVFIGISNADFARANAGSDHYTKIQPYSFTGSAFSVAAGRISYLFGLQGPNYPIDTACSSSLVAVHSAVQSLRNRESDIALAGGINLLLTPEAFIASCRLGALSKSAHAAPFDNHADGYIRGEGCGVIVLKRLTDAQKNKDNILAIIKGSAVNHDGKSSGLTAPNGLAQIKVIAKALANAGISPQQVDYIEAHGSGTLIGDPQEVNALAGIFAHQRKHKLLIGSVKSNIGHLEAAAGMAGLIKTILALNHKKIPASLNFVTPNQHIPWEKIPIAVADKLTDWNVKGKPRIAGISAFGLSGTNAHIIVEELPDNCDKPRNPAASTYIINLSAKTDHALDKLVEQYIPFLDQDTGPDILDISYTSILSRGNFKKRISLVGRSKAEFKHILTAYRDKKNNKNLHHSPHWELQSDKVAFLFAGQGLQYTGMAMELYETLPEFRAEIDRCDHIIHSLTQESIIKIIKGPGAEEKLNQPVFAHLALFSIEYALAKMWTSFGVRPGIIVGHSTGEYTAACLAGVFSLEDALKLVHRRGQLMESLPKNGLMTAAFCSPDTIHEMIAPYKDTIAVAAVNAPGLIVLSGLKNTVNKIKHRLDEMNIYTKCMESSSSQAFFSPFVELIMPEFEKSIRDMKIEFHNPSIPFISTVTGEKAADNQLTSPQYWLDHMRQTVRFSDALNTAKKDGFQVFLEIGPTSTLTQLGKSSFGDDDVLWVASLNKTNNDWEQILRAAGELYVHRINLDWDKIATLFDGKKAILPNYPFERKKFPIDLTGALLGEREGNMEMIDRQFDIMSRQLDLLGKNS
ncbi:MAG TPA: beta-ketoacyl synthase N-terminal-like domain-containing protein, partial [Candidatus Deferrimicrobium sp.]|nr:beta-ketoacyl synthase N-terminal-like domain-containing protein [Candidatus Deferrimicrobium sp.]